MRAGSLAERGEASTELDEWAIRRGGATIRFGEAATELDQAQAMAVLR